ncbi:citrate/2-methylcitrate synthase, partial [Thiotrichales bacterium HSG1]|nr:citrate/2-methylcitrate synthase [Thiotrichales bacterium HSG1]
MKTGKVGAGLRGQSAGETALCTVGVSGTGLTYRGYDITELAQKATFEEVAYMILHGKAPNKQELYGFIDRLKARRGLPEALKTVLEHIPANAHPMDVMRTGCSVLGNLEMETDFSQQKEISERMLAVFPSIICYWYRYSHDGVRINTEVDDNSIGSHFLHLLHDEVPTELYQQVMSVSLILYAEHEFNASTFNARVCASTLSDLYSCITSAISTLRGPWHGGANEAAMAMLENWQTPDEAEQAVLDMLARKDKIMGFGHPVYTVQDPRNPIIKS